MDFRRGESLGKKDHLIVYTKPKKPDWLAQDLYDMTPDSLTVRELAVEHKILVTTIRSPKVASKTELKQLYQQRWHIELDLRNIKTTLGMTVLTCKSPDMIEKEIWVYLLAYNLIRLVMAQAALLSAVLPRQLSFKHTLQLWRTWRGQASVSDDSIMLLLLLIAEKRVANRPGRVEPRAVKRWRKSYPLLTEPRQSLRDSIKKHGHPRKEK